MTERDEFLNEFADLVDLHPLRDDFYAVVFHVAEQMNVPPSLFFTDEPHILLKEWQDLKEESGKRLPWGLGEPPEPAEA